ncbi:MAG: hypothetical protein J5530_00970, partial [Clostridia bacterium]|nr:hypothetical protein [Clostridia bacterium]
QDICPQIQCICPYEYPPLVCSSPLYTRIPACQQQIVQNPRVIAAPKQKTDFAVGLLPERINYEKTLEY